MICSLNEIGATIRKAAVASEYPVGLADSIASSVVWLCARGLDGVGAGLDAVAAGIRPVVDNDMSGSVLHVRGVDVGRYGPSLFELIAAADCEQVEIDELDSPLLLIGLAGIVSRATETAFELSTEAGVSLVVSADTVAIPPEFAEGARRLTITAASGAQCDTAPGAQICGGIEVDDRRWTAASKLAARTHVPATDESRLRGAGAGLDDND